MQRHKLNRSNCLSRAWRNRLKRQTKRQERQAAQRDLREQACT